MFNCQASKPQLALYLTTIYTILLGLLYMCFGCFIIGEFLPLLPGVFENPLWGLLYLYIIISGVYTVVVGCVGFCGVSKFEPGTICLHRVLVLLLASLHIAAIVVFSKDVQYNRERVSNYLSRSIQQVLASEGVSAAKRNEKIWNYFEAALNCQRIQNNCEPSAAVDYLMLLYYIFIAFLGASALILLLDLLLTIVL